MAAATLADVTDATASRQVEFRPPRAQLSQRYLTEVCEFVEDAMGLAGERAELVESHVFFRCACP